MFCTSLVSWPRMASQNGGSAHDSDLQKMNSTTPPLEQIYPFRRIVNSEQRRRTRAFARDENIEDGEIPDAGQPVFQHRETENQPTTTVESPKRPSSMKEDEEEIKPSNRLGIEAVTPSQVDVSDPKVLPHHGMSTHLAANEIISVASLKRPHANTF